ncbi:YodC family protein [Sphingomonas sp. OTU376]|uniref:YodC family protein n=1 Tax=Sphingomonas sp. OTU376 TaxID=3043863 RepID=UPI00313CE1AF
MDEIKEGSVVRLKSGGPAMTVIFLTAGAYSSENDPKNKAHCQWFAESGGKPLSETFPLTSLLLDE